MEKIVPRELSPARIAAALLMQLLLTGCPAPGQGAKAEQWYRRAEPIIGAIERFKKEQGSYPASLAALPADWLPQKSAHDERPSITYGFHYVLRDGAFELTFGYAGPGVNRCTYHSATLEGKPWRCSGYY